jgi:phospholipase C
MGAVDRSVATWHLRRRSAPDDADRLPDPSVPAGTDTIPQIKHIVLLMMENHSFDNYLGTLGRGEGFSLNADGIPAASNLRKDGSEVAAHEFAMTTQSPDVPSQSWRASHMQYGQGANDGFVRSIEDAMPGADPAVAMGYWTERQLPFYAGLARTFPVADRWFGSCLGPTFPNRRFLLAATANGLIDDIPAGMMDYPKTGTIFDLMDRYNIIWANYHHVRRWRLIPKRLLGGGGLRLLRGLALAVGTVVPRLIRATQGNIQFTADLFPLGVWRCLRHLRGMDRFWADAAAGTLPAVSIVDPNFSSGSEENPQDIQRGEAFAAQVISAVMQGKGWPGTLLIWFYDEHGGYYDHVPPPPAVEPDHVLPRSLLTTGGPLKWLLQHAGLWKKLATIDSGRGRYDRYGFRVPAVLVSPYAKPRYVSSIAYDHTSALKLIERKWNLPPLTRRDAAASDPLDMVDFDSPAAFLDPPRLPAAARPGSRHVAEVPAGAY